MGKKKKIFIAALNWGLGHATRCFPIIESLERADVELILASDGQAGAVWRDNFPHLSYYELPSYGISYPYKSMVLNIGLQLPRIYQTMRQERKFLADIVQKERIDAIISDNRFGLYHPDIFSIFMTHQLHPIIPNFILQKLAWGYYHRLISRFSQCWVVDTPNSDLAGQLSRLPRRLKGEYIGALSRFSPIVGLSPQLYDVAFLLSGVEPQRSIFENLCLKQAALFPNKRFILIRGLPNTENNLTIIPPNVEIRAYCAAQELAFILERTEIVVARSGYSTIMDLQQLGVKKAILVPTPAQTEQEFLAKQLLLRKNCYTCAQVDFDLSVAFAQLSNFSGFQPVNGENLLQKAVNELLARL